MKLFILCHIFGIQKSHILLCVALHLYVRSFSLSTNLLFLKSVEFNVCIKGASNQKSKYVEYFAAAVVGNDKGDSLLFATRLALLHFYAWTISFSYCPLQIMPAPFKLMSIGIYLLFINDDTHFLIILNPPFPLSTILLNRFRD